MEQVFVQRQFLRRRGPGYNFKVERKMIVAVPVHPEQSAFPRDQGEGPGNNGGEQPAIELVKAGIEPKVGFFEAQGSGPQPRHDLPGRQRTFPAPELGPLPDRLARAPEFS